MGSFAAWLAIAACSMAPPAVDGPRDRPNVLILLADDFRPDAIAALGHPVVRTPNLDALVRRGAVFHNAYCLGSNSPAVCQPSRNMLLSGRAYFRWEGPLAPADERTLPAVFRGAGYETYHHGKRGNVATRIQASFEHDRYVQDDRERRSGRPGARIAEAAVDFLRTRSGDRPFLMFLAFEAPHDPRVADPGDLAAYDAARLPLPPNFLPLHPFDNGELTVRDEALAPWPRTEDEIRRHLREYYAVITGFDRSIGLVLDALEDLELADETVVVFTSDNGLAVGSHGLMGKQSLYDHSMRVPLIVGGQGIPPGKHHELVYLLDLFPTLCDLASIDVPAGLDGRSFAESVLGRGPAPRSLIFTAYRDGQRAIRDGRYKLIRYPLIHRTQLFDLMDDSDEMHDLSGDPAQRDRVDRMMAALADEQRRFGDVLPLTAADPRDPSFTPPISGGPASGGRSSR